MHAKSALPQLIQSYIELAGLASVERNLPHFLSLFPVYKAFLLTHFLTRSMTAPCARSFAVKARVSMF